MGTTISQEEIDQLFEDDPADAIPGQAVQDSSPGDKLADRVYQDSSQQELWLVETQASLQDETMLVATLTAGLDDALRNTSDQYSNFTRQLEYMRRDLKAEVEVADEAQRQLRHHDYKMTAQMREVDAELQAQQARAAALQQALQAAQAQHAQEKAGMQMEVQQEHNRAEEAEGFLGDAHAQVDNLEAQLNKMASKMRKVAIKLHFAINPTHKGKVHWGRSLRTAKHRVTKMRLSLEEAHRQCFKEQGICEEQQYHIEELTQQLASLQAEVAQLRAAQANLRQLEAPSTLQLEYNRTPISPVSPWSLATSPEHLWDTSTITPASSLSGGSPRLSWTPASRTWHSPASPALGLLAAAPSPHLGTQLDDARTAAEKYSDLTLKLEYMGRDLKAEEEVASEAERKLRHRECEMAAQMREAQALLQAQAAAFQQDMQAAQAEHAQSKARSERLESTNAYQGAELMNLQREVYHLRSLLSSHGIDPTLAPRSAVSPWSLAATPEHLWDTTTPEHLRDTASITPSSIMSPLFSRRPASRALQSPLAGSLGLSAAAPSPYTTHPAAAIAFSPSTSSSGQRPVFTSATPASSLSTLTGKADVSAGRRSSSSKQSQVAAPHSATFSGSPVAGLCRTRPQILVRMTKKQKARQEAVASKIATTSTSASGPAPATASTVSPSHDPTRVTSVRRRLDATLGTAARPSPTAGKTCIRGDRSLTSRSPLSRGKRPSVGGRGSMVANSCSSGNKENSPAPGKAETPASSWVSQQQSPGSKAPAQLTPFSTACRRTPLAPRTAAGVNATPAMTPHALQFHVVAVPFWGLQDPVPLAAASVDAMPTTAVTTTTSSAGASTATATTPASGMTTATATRAAAGMTTAYATTATAAAASMTTVDATAATVATAAESASPAKAGTAGEGVTTAVLCEVESQVAEQIIPTDAPQADAVAVPAVTRCQAPEPDAVYVRQPVCYGSTASGATATTAAGGMTTAVVVDKAPVAEATGAQQAAASVVPSQAHLPDTPPDERRQKPCCSTTTAATTRLFSPPASGSVTSSQQITADRQSADSFATSTTADLPAAVAANKVQHKNRRRRTASAASPVASQMVTRSQAAALKHVQRMQTRNKARR